MRSIILLALLGFTGPCAAAKPNVLLIYLDDSIPYGFDLNIGGGHGGGPPSGYFPPPRCAAIKGSSKKRKKR